MIKAWFDNFLEWMYPPKCLLCRELLPLEKSARDLCNRCSENLPWIQGEVCQQCGTPLNTDEQTRCGRCKQSPFVFDKAVCVFIYKDVRQTIKHFKFQGCKYDAIGLGKIMGKYLKTFYPHLLEKVEYLIPVPMHEKKQRKREFNQSTLLAKEIEKQIGIPCMEDCLLRTKNTAPQSSLNPAQRRSNIQGAFHLKDGKRLQGKNVLLVDDIFTTGATVNECTATLYQAGTEKVTVFCLAIAVD